MCKLDDSVCAAWQTLPSVPDQVVGKLDSTSLCGIIFIQILLDLLGSHFATITGGSKDAAQRITTTPLATIRSLQSTTFARFSRDLRKRKYFLPWCAALVRHF